MKGQVVAGTTRSCGCGIHNRPSLLGKAYSDRYVVWEDKERRRVRLSCGCGRSVLLSRNRLPGMGRCACKLGRMIEVKGKLYSLSDCGRALGMCRERARQLANKGKLKDRMLKVLNDQP